jgi:hypothetical protein
MQKTVENPSGFPDSGVLRIGPFRVSASHEEVAAFRRETGWSEDEHLTDMRVPHTFPMRWLSTPDIRGVIETRLKEAGGVAFHESQNFNYDMPLAADQDYWLTAEVDRQENPSRLILRVAIASLSEQPCLKLETILRIVAPAEATP